MPDSGELPDAPASTTRLRLLQGAVLALLLILVAGLAHHQIARADVLAQQERRQSQRQILLPAPRGQIFDREHRLLAGTRFRTALVLDLGPLRSSLLTEERIRRETTSGMSPRKMAMEARVAVIQREWEKPRPLLDPTRKLSVERIERHFTREPALPFVLVDALADDEIARVSAVLSADGALRLEKIPERYYPHGRVAAHVIGRVRKERIQTDGASSVRTVAAEGLSGDFGLEKQFDATLSGQPAAALLRVDAMGRPAGGAIPTTPAIAGEDIVTSLDLDLQLVAESALDAVSGASRGSIVVLDVRTGEILALASRPDFDLNLISPTISPTEKERLDTSGAWLNRATQALYPPGSSHKVFTALAGLRSGALDAYTTHTCAGFLQIGTHRFPCHHVEGHGLITLRTALSQSCNIFAYQIGLAAGADALADEARRFHLDAPTGVELPGETPRMLVPDPARKHADKQDPWTLGDTANFAIGQGFLRYSPLQAACAMASLARRETLTVPTLLRQPQRSPSGVRAREPLAISEENYAALLSSLEAVVEAGIGQNAQVPGVRIAGKTGTAQIVRPEGMMNVAWFIAFAPADNPQIALAIALEGDQPNVEYAGAAHAAPVASDVFAAYFDKLARPAAEEARVAHAR